ncbi:outer membrane beta-barrel protein [Pedobacter sp. Leaf176]|uniref:type IX secretion/gliding motility protein PorT/SprT n=1 Tax=Pedobacter sp. Leaf176 TaxID=1736286 RepID=UPI0006F536BC|nr:outer membrane beta-barrel protein [Pedobacter sp. Leaf176]KQR68125.1 porin [Pedobacter sp. Leaf176]
MTKRLSLIIFLLMIVTTSFAQNWGGGVDDEDIHFGFSFQYISAEYKILKSANWRNAFYETEDGNSVAYNPNMGRQITQPMRAISSPPSVGFGLGFVVNKRISENFDLRATPSLIFSDRIIRYEYEPAPQVTLPVNNSVTPPAFQTTIDKKVQATMFEIPFGIKIKSNRLNNFRVYWLGGAKYSMDIASKKKTFDEGETQINKLLKNKRSYLSYETGIGFDLYFEHFKMSPELKLSYSMQDILQHDNTAFANPLDKTKLRHFTFSLFFE